MAQIPTLVHSMRGFCALAFCTAKYNKPYARHIYAYGHLPCCIYAPALRGQCKINISCIVVTTLYQPFFLKALNINYLKKLLKGKSGVY
jgi:hypothetical protein